MSEKPGDRAPMTAMPMRSVVYRFGNDDALAHARSLEGGGNPARGGAEDAHIRFDELRAQWQGQAQEKA